MTTAAPASRRSDLTCSADSAATAIAFCSVCADPYSARFIKVRLDGRAVCVRCAAEHNIEFLAQSVDATKNDPVLTQGVWRAFKQVLLQPHVALPGNYKGPLLPSVMFGFICTMLGTLMWLVWQMLLKEEKFFEAFNEVLITSEAELGGANDALLAGAMFFSVAIILPALRILFGAGALHLGIRMTGGRETTFAQSLRIFCLSSCSLLLCIIPAVGPILAVVAWFSSVLAYLRIQHRVGMFKAMLVLLPAMIVLTLFPPR